MTSPPPGSTSGSRLVLGSGSPRRSELLRALHVPFDVVVPGIEEPSGATASELALAKFEHLDGQLTGRTVVTADTVVMLGTSQLGKPRDRAEARHMLRQCSGKAILVVTAVVAGSAENINEESVTSIVQLLDLSDDDIANYVATGAADDKAGSLALQDEAAGFVDRSSRHLQAGCSGGGCFSNVVGLPLCVVARLIGVEPNPQLCAWP